MGNISNKRKRSVERDIYMDRNFGLPSGQVTQREPLSPNLFMKVGTRLGVITAYYKHLSLPSVPVNVNSSTCPVPSCPVVNLPSLQNPPKVDQGLPEPEIHIYDVPKNNKNLNE